MSILNFVYCREKPKYLKSAGTLYGLSVVLDPQLDDYMYPAHISQGFKVCVVLFCTLKMQLIQFPMICMQIHVFYTYDYPDPNTGNTVVRFIPVDNKVNIKIAARTTHSVPSVKQFSIDQVLMNEIFSK